jgi:hypothetical protein
MNDDTKSYHLAELERAARGHDPRFQMTVKISGIANSTKTLNITPEQFLSIKNILTK